MDDETKLVNGIIKEVNNVVKHWYIPMIIGLLSIALGIWTISRPMESYLGLSILFIAIFLVSGVSEIIFAISNRKEIDHWGWELTNGILSLTIGVIMVMNPALSATTLPFYVGFVIMFRSMMAISASLEIKKYGVLEWGNLMAFGILGLVFSFIMLWNPLFAGFSIVFWTGLAFITLGMFSTYSSFKLKKLHTYKNQ